MAREQDNITAECSKMAGKIQTEKPRAPGYHDPARESVAAGHTLRTDACRSVPADARKAR
jgi:hypothetical protein